MENKDKKALVVLSGGMDSTTVLYRALTEFREVEAISFDYGQRHAIELQRAVATCKKLNVKHKVADVSFLKDLFANNALTGDIEVPEGHYEADNMDLTVVPNRNSIFANIAAGYALNIEADTLALGVHGGDHHIYVDCRPAFVDALAALLKVVDNRVIDLYTPYLNDDKIKIIEDGIKLGVDYSLTHTCYKGNDFPCGKCGSCTERIEAFDANGIMDPLIAELIFFCEDVLSRYKHEAKK